MPILHKHIATEVTQINLSTDQNLEPIKNPKEGAERGEENKIKSDGVVDRCLIHKCRG